MKFNTYVIGDIHGNYLALLNLLNKINFDFNNDTLIVLGDICDGWPQTFECIELLKKIKNKILIKGNHDEWCVELLSDYINDTVKFDNFFVTKNWLHHGGTGTVESYYKHLEYLDDHLNFLKNSLNYYIDKNNNLFIHAGYSYIKPVKDKNIYDPSFIWDRYYVQDMINNKKHNIDMSDINFNEVYIGHTPTIIYDEYKPIIHNNIYLMDTGVAFTGYLSCINLETKEIFQSDLSGDQYYPDHTGRNNVSYNDKKNI